MSFLSASMSVAIDYLLFAAGTYFLDIYLPLVYLKCIYLYWMQPFAWSQVVAMLQLCHQFPGLSQITTLPAIIQLSVSYFGRAIITRLPVAIALYWSGHEY